MTRQVPIILNPTAGGGRAAGQREPLEAAARAAGITLDWWLTRCPGHAEELARRAAEQERDLVLAYGGDGTYNEVARGLLGSDTALGAIPGGTTSVLAYELSIPRKPAQALQQLLDGDDRLMRVGRTDRGDLFLLMVSAGPDSVILHRLLPLFKRLGGRVGVAAQAMVELMRYRSAALRATFGGQTIDGGWAIVGNCRCYAGPFHATPDADPFSDQLELVMLRRNGRWASSSFALGIATGRHVRRADVAVRSLQRVRLEAAPGTDNIPYQVDGDVKGQLPIEIWVEPEPLRMRLPAPLAGEIIAVESETFATP